MDLTERPEVLEESGKLAGIIDIPEDDYPDFADATRLPDDQCTPGGK